jgi:hypothetical protein
MVETAPITLEPLIVLAQVNLLVFCAKLVSVVSFIWGSDTTTEVVEYTVTIIASIAALVFILLLFGGVRFYRGYGTMILWIKINFVQFVSGIVFDQSKHLNTNKFSGRLKTIWMMPLVPRWVVRCLSLHQVNRDILQISLCGQSNCMDSLQPTGKKSRNYTNGQRTIYQIPS